MIDITYESFIFRADDALEKFDHELHRLMINIMLHGELKHWNEETAIGETYEFNTELIASCDDENLQLLVSLYKKLMDTKQKFKLRNNLG